MSAGLKYGLARVGLFVVFAIPLTLLLPDGIDVLVKLMIALVLSAAVSFFLLRPLRDQVSEAIVTNRQRKDEERSRLREALAGESSAAAENTAPAESTAAGKNPGTGKNPAAGKDEPKTS